LFFFGFLFYRILTLLGIYMLYVLYEKKQSKSSMFLIFYLIIVSTYFTQSAFYIFNLTAFILLTLITIELVKGHFHNPRTPSMFVPVSFGIIALSYVSFMILKIDPIYYVIGEIIELVGYMLLLFAFILVLRHGKKTK
jgi:hypothetical protein